MNRTPAYSFLFHGHRKLGDKRCGDHESAAEKLTPGHELAEQQRAEHRAEEGLKAQQQRDDRGVAALLGEDLEGVAKAA